MTYLDNVKNKREAQALAKVGADRLKAFTELATEIRTLLASLEKSGAKKLDKNLVSAINKLGNVAKSIDSIKVTSDKDIKTGLRALSIAIQKLDTRPVVNVPQAKVEVNEREIDFKPLIAEIKKLDRKAPTVSIDTSSLIDSVDSVKKAIKAMRMPVANYVLPYKNTQGAATQVQLDSSGNVPVVVTGGGGGDATAANQVLQLAQETDINANIGAKADTVASSDTGTFSLIALVKRVAQWLTTIAGYNQALAGTVSGSEIQADVVSSALPAGASTLAKQDDIITAIGAIPSGGGVQYTEGDVDATPTGTVPVWRDDANGDVLHAVAYNLPLPVQDTQVATNTQGVASYLADLAGTIVAEDNAVSDGQYLLMTGVTRKDTPVNTSNTDGDAETLQMSAGRLWTSSKIDTALPAGNNNIGDVDVASSVLPTGAATAANQQTDALTDAELRATPVPVSGTVTSNLGTLNGAATSVKQDTIIGHVDGVETAIASTNTKLDTVITNTDAALTDAELRATPVPVSGTVTANAGTNLNTSALLTTAAHDAAFGTAGSADAQVRSIQGVASMTPVQVSQATAANLNATVVQGTGSNLHTVVDSGTITTVSAVTAITNALPAGTNNIGDVDVLSAVSSTLDHGSNLDIDTTAEQITATSFACKFGVTLRAPTSNTGILYIGNSDVTVSGTAATDGIPLYPGDSIFLPVTNSNIPYAIASANNQIIYWIAV